MHATLEIVNKVQTALDGTSRQLEAMWIRELSAEVLVVSVSLGSPCSDGRLLEDVNPAPLYERMTLFEVSTYGLLLLSVQIGDSRILHVTFDRCVE